MPAAPLSATGTRRPLTLLFSTDYYYPYASGGTEAVVRRLAELLATRGHAVHVATLDAEHLPLHEIVHGVHVHRFPAVDLTRLLGLQLRASWTFPRAIGRLIDELRPDVVNAHNAYFFTTLATVVAARRRPCASFLTLHLNSPAQLDMPGRLPALVYEASLARLAVHLAQRIICVGQSVAEHATATFDLRVRPDIVPNGVDASLFTPAETPPPTPVVLFVGRLLANKGPDVFIDAALQLLNRGCSAEFWLAGDGPMRADLERRAAGQSRIRFLGERRDVADLMRAATIFARPSTLEGFPLTVLEAMASGLPVVATDIPGNVDLVQPGTTGALCQPRSASALAAKIGELLADPYKAREMGRRGRATVLAKYTWERTAQTFEELAFSSQSNATAQPILSTLQDSWQYR